MQRPKVSEREVAERIESSLLVTRNVPADPNGLPRRLRHLHRRALAIEEPGRQIRAVRLRLPAVSDGEYARCGILSRSLG